MAEQKSKPRLGVFSWLFIFLILAFGYWIYEDGPILLPALVDATSQAAIRSLNKLGTDLTTAAQGLAGQTQEAAQKAAQRAAGGIQR
jgi:hypothetical protein